MASKNTIGIVLAVQGEKQFNQALQNSRKEAGSLKSELNLLSAEYDGNANSLEYLQKKQAILEKQTKTYKDTIKTTEKALANAQETQKKATENYEKLEKELDEARKAMAEMVAEGKEGSKEYKDQANKVEALAKAVERQATQCNKASGKVSDWSAKLNNAKANLTKTNTEIKQNEKYLDEAANSTDKCAKSIDEYGKKTKEAASVTTTWGGALKNAIANQGVGTAVDAIKNGVTAAADAIKESMVDISSATSSLSAQTGLTGKALEEYKNAMESIRGDNFGESYQEVAEAMGLVYQTMGQISETDMTSVTESLLTLQDTFDMDMNETLRGAQSLVTHFGVSATEAFDLIAAGAQNGLNYTDELGDNLSEYAGKFAEAGYSVEEYFQLLENGTEGGAYNLDKVNDAINEVTTRLADGTVEDSIDLFSDATKETFKAWKDGGATQKEVIDAIVSDIQNTTNEQEKMNMAAEAFGTMAEDGGTKFIESLTSVGDAFDDVQGKMDNLANTKYDNLADAWSGLGAAVQESFITPIAEKVEPLLTDVVNGVTDVISGIGDSFEEPKSELQTFIEEIEQSNDEVNAIIESASGSVESAESQMSNLEAYKSTLLDLNEKTSLSEFEQYQLKNAVEALGDSVPGLSDAFDSVTGTLNLTNEELSEMFNNAEALAMQNAILEAQEELYDAMAQAVLNKAKADSAAKTAQEELNDAIAASQESGDIYGEYNVAISDAQAALEDATKAQEEATQAEKEAQEQIDANKGVYDDLAEKYGIVSDSAEETAETVEETKEAVARTYDEWGNDITDLSDEQVSALAEIEEAYDDMKDSIEDSISSSIDLMDEFSGGTKVSTDEIKQNLQSQITGISQWSDNMQTLAGQIGTSFTQEMYDAIAEQGPESANMVQTLVDALNSNTGDFEQIAAQWGEALKLKDEAEVVAAYTSAGQAAGEGMAQGLEEANGQVVENAEALGEQTGAAAKQGVETGAANTQVEIVTSDDVTQNEGEINAAGQQMGESAKSGLESVSMEETGKTHANQYINALKSYQSAAASAAGSLASAARSAAASWSNSFYTVGYNMSIGVANGIRGGQSSVVNAAVNVAYNALKAAKSELGIHSPSSVFRDQIGKQIAEGLRQGIVNNSDMPAKAAAEMSERIYQESYSWIKKQKKSYGYNSMDLMWYWAKIVGLTKEGTSGYNKAVSKMNTAIVKQLKTLTDWYDGTGSNRKKKTYEEYYGDLYSSAEDYMTQLQKLQNVSTRDQISYWKAVRNSCNKTTEAWENAQAKIVALKDQLNDEIYDSAESYMSQLESAGEASIKYQLGYWQKVQKQLKKGTDAWYSAAEKINSLKQQIGTVSNMSNLLTAYQTYYSTSARAEMQYWDIVRKKYVEGSDERLEADQKYYEAKESYESKLEELEDDYLDKVKDVNDQLEDDIKDLTDTYNDELQSQKDSIMSAFDMFDEFTSESSDGKTLLFNIKTQAAGYEDWMEQLDKLQSRGILSDTLMDALTEQGPEISASIHALNDLTDDQLREYNEAYTKKEELSQKQAEKNTADLKKETETQISALKKQASSDLKDLKDTYKDEVAEVKTTISSELKELANKTKSISEDQTTKLVAVLAGKKSNDKVISAISSGKSLSSLSTSERSKHHDLYNYLYDNYGVAGSNAVYKSLASALGVSVSKTVTDKQKDEILTQLKKKGYASGGKISDVLTWMDEDLDDIGPEMIVRKSDNAILTRTKPGDQVIDATTTANLVKIGQYTPDDLANMVRAKANSLASLSSIGSVGTTAQINSLLDMGAKAEQSSQTARLESLMGQMNQIIDGFAPYIQKIGSNSQIYLDGDKLVGGLSDRISTDLASRQRRTR